VPVGAATSIVLASPILNAVLTATPGEGLQLYDIGSRRHAGGTPLWANPQPFPQGATEPSMFFLHRAVSQFALYCRVFFSSGRPC
jgi:hypothetical protein